MFDKEIRRMANFFKIFYKHKRQDGGRHGRRNGSGKQKIPMHKPHICPIAAFWEGA